VLSRENHHNPRIAKFSFQLEMFRETKLYTLGEIPERKFGEEKRGNNSHHKNKEA